MRSAKMAAAFGSAAAAETGSTASGAMAMAQKTLCTAL
jgi:hypothetical protein